MRPIQSCLQCRLFNDDVCVLVLSRRLYLMIWSDGRTLIIDAWFIQCWLFPAHAHTKSRPNSRPDSHSDFTDSEIWSSRRWAKINLIQSNRRRSIDGSFGKLFCQTSKIICSLFPDDLIAFHGTRDKSRKKKMKKKKMRDWPFIGIGFGSIRRLVAKQFSGTSARRLRQCNNNKPASCSLYIIHLILFIHRSRRRRRRRKRPPRASAPKKVKLACLCLYDRDLFFWLCCCHTHTNWQQTYRKRSCNWSNLSLTRVESLAVIAQGVRACVARVEQRANIGSQRMRSELLLHTPTENINFRHSFRLRQPKLEFEDCMQ